MSTKGRVNPKKVKKEKIKKIEQNTNNMIAIDNDDVRAPLDSYAEQLLPSNHTFTFNQEDDDFKRILELSRREFEEQQNNYGTNYLNEECIEQSRIEQERIELGRIEQERIEQERIDILKLERRNSLLNFTNRINKLVHVKEDKKIKELIDNILEKYFNLEIDNFKLNKKDYIDLYKIIDTYYLIPSSKNIKTAITKEENNLVRNIFLK